MRVFIRSAKFVIDIIFLCKKNKNVVFNIKITLRLRKLIHRLVVVILQRF